MDKKGTILIVDDEPINISMLAEILNSDYNLKISTNATTALEILNKNSKNIDLILLDVIMPNMSGYELGKIIKNSSELSSIPFIFLTAKSDSNSIIEGFLIGAVDYISKPFHKEELLVRVDTHIKLYKFQQHLEDIIEEQKRQIVIQTKKSAMGEMISIIAHQLKQPLNAIYLMAENVIDAIEFNDLNSDDLTNSMNNIVNRIDFMSKLIDDYRNFFNPNKQPEIFNLKNSILKAITIIDPSLQTKQIELIKELEDNVFVKGFTNDIGQVIINILTNAKDAIIERNVKKPFIKIELKKDDLKAIIRIVDNAGGIDELILPKIFDNYFSTKGDKGTGIGLALAKMLIEDSFRGTIKAYNEDSGAVFEIVLKAID